jgi:hypothetical protein
MKKKIRKMAKKAGFVFWKNEDWGPGKNKIDWSSDYTDSFNKFIRLLVKDCSKKHKK